MTIRKQELPHWRSMTHEGRCGEAIDLCKTVEDMLGVNREDKHNADSKYDAELGEIFGVGRETWRRYRKGLLKASSRRRIKYQTIRNKLHAFIVDNSGTFDTQTTVEPEAPTETDNKIVTLAPLIDNTENVGLNFRVPPDFAREFKHAALTAGMKQNAFLENLLRIYQADDFKQLLHQWLERIKEINDRFDVHEAGLTHERSVSTRVQENTKRDFDALKKSCKDAITAVNDRLDGLAKHNQQLQKTWWKVWR